MGNTPVTLPQDDEQVDTRQRKLHEARRKYELEQHKFGLSAVQQRLVNIGNLPPMLSKLPPEENQSLYYKIRFAAQYLFYALYALFQCLIGCGRQWTIDRMIQHFKFPCLLKEPKGCEVWRKTAINREEQTELQRMQADHWFAWQRLNGVTRNLIRRVEGNVPLQFSPFLKTIERNHPYLTGRTLQVHIEQNTLYVVNLTEVALGEPTLLAPVSLFVVFNGMLMPVAVWINSMDNDIGQVSIPNTLSDNERLRHWVKTRILFNMLEAQYHESVTHLGFTHILMDGVSVCMHRNLSKRHPIYKILLPHFRYMHAINIAARDDLLPPGGYIEKDMYIRRVLMLKLISKHNENWVYDPIQTSLENRGAMDIPGYFFKDDALQLEGAIRQFVHQYVTHYYKNDDRNVQEDGEIQGFYQELTAARAMKGYGGCGMNGIPEINTMENLIDVLTYFIYTCSVEHSATNFPQYEQYAFPPNFAALLHGQPEDEMADLDASMPSRKEMFSTIKIMKVLTLVLTNSLGNYESVYTRAMDSFGRNCVAAFQQHLAAIQNRINNRNADIMARNNPNQLQEYQYEWLLPKNVLNSISI
ncbi:polyunsaturated fatty acid lipoxygenase ALOX8 [Magallana gigas]|uniref:polyunsaturated fatty acid lipoxygenase ALOX8 n=1 Tax=Magallana gigas TaxID=29159 RepID=UPI00333F1AAD